MGEIREMIQGLMDRFNERAGDDQKFAEFWKDKVRRISIEFTDGETFGMTLRDGRLVDLDIRTEADPDIRIITTTECFRDLIGRRIHPMKALALRRLRVKASIEDMLAIRKML